MSSFGLLQLSGGFRVSSYYSSARRLAVMPKSFGSKPSHCLSGFFFV